MILSPEKSALWKFSVSERMEAEGALGWELRSSALRVNPLPMKFISSFYAGDNKMASETHDNMAPLPSHIFVMDWHKILSGKSL